jgi:hypothetical protein
LKRKSTEIYRPARGLRASPGSGDPLCRHKWNLPANRLKLARTAADKHREVLTDNIRLLPRAARGNQAGFQQPTSPRMCE